MSSERSPIVVISWWSNCLALACLRRLGGVAPDRELYVVQVGKSAEQQTRFRALVPAYVREIDYPATAPAEHSRGIAHVAFTALALRDGLWFVDHDVFMDAPIAPWLDTMDATLAASPAWLCLPPENGGPAITQPAFWMSPVRWADARLPLDPDPYRETETARRPDLFPSSGELRLPSRDTLVQARDALRPSGRVCHYRDFPAHSHLGGLSLFTGLALPFIDAWTRATVHRFTTFFASCPPDWLAAEEPTLLRRCGEFREALDA